MVREAIIRSHLRVRARANYVRELRKTGASRVAAREFRHGEIPRLAYAKRSNYR